VTRVGRDTDVTLRDADNVIRCQRGYTTICHKQAYWHA